MSKGRKHSEETKQKMREIAHRRLTTPEGREQLRRAGEKAWEARRGLKESEELREKRAEIVRARMKDPEERRKILDCLDKAPSRTGIFTDEHRKILSEAKKGSSPSEATREKIRQANLGKEQSAETKRKRSETLKRIGHGWQNKGRKQPPEERARRGAAIKKAHARPEVKKKHAEAIQRSWDSRGNKHTEETRRKMKEARAKQVVPMQDTKPEQVVQAILDRAGIVYRKHKTLKRMPFHQWDIVIDDAKLLIEVDGCFWHGCERCIPKERRKIGEQNRQRDKLYTKAAEEQGWQVLRLWEHEIAEGQATEIIFSCLQENKELASS